MADRFECWPLLSQQLAQRAATYSRINQQKRDNASNTSDIVNFADLISKNDAERKPWWWPQIPLLKALLEQKNDGPSLAIWVTLGRYGWDVGKHKSKIVWINFLSQELDVNEDDFYRSLRFLDTEQYKNDSDKRLLVSSDLVDAMNRNDDHIEKPPMVPLLYCFDGNTIEADKEFLRVASWQDTRKILNTKCFQDTVELDERIDCGVNLLASIDPASGFLEGTEWWDKKDANSQSRLKTRLKAFIAWLHSMPCQDKWDTILTVPPTWHPKELSGVYATGIVIYVRKSNWISTLTSQEDLITEISTFVSAFRAGTLIVFSEVVREFYEAKRIAEKQAQMLRLLETPLESLTKALERTQGDAQTLRSILYEPHNSLFAVAPLVMDYFTEGRICQYGSVRWIARHIPDACTRMGPPAHSGAATVAAAICLAMGHKPRDDETEFQMLVNAKALLESNNPAFSGLQEVTKYILWGGGDGKKDVFFAELSGCLKRECGGILVVEALKKIKSIVFTPFKFSTETTPLLPLAIILYDNDFRGHLIIKEGKTRNLSITDILRDWKIGANDEESVFPSNGLLVSRYSDVLRLVSGVLAYNRSEPNAKIIEVEVTKTSIIVNESDPPVNRKTTLRILFNKPIFKDMNSTYKKMSDHHEKRIHTSQGNFQKPFLDFAAAVEKDIKVSNSIRPRHWKVYNDAFENVIYINKTEFSITVNRRGAM